MAYNYEYPSVNMNDYNNDWLINKVKELAREWLNVQKDWSDMQTAYNELKSWITDYFNNLDVQNEINQKLDEMLTSGELQSILLHLVSDYVAPIVVDSVEEMTNRNKLYILKSTGNLYQWNGNAFSDTGLAYVGSLGNVIYYQGTLEDNSDLNNTQPQTIYGLSSSYTYLNLPSNFDGAGWLSTYGVSFGGYQELLEYSSGRRYYRVKAKSEYINWVEVDVENTISYQGTLEDNSDLNNTQPQTIYGLSSVGNYTNIPEFFTHAGWLLTAGSTAGGFQRLIDWTTGDEYYRVRTGAKYRAWLMPGYNIQSRCIGYGNSILSGYMNTTSGAPQSIYTSRPYGVMCSAVNIPQHNVEWSYLGGTGILYDNGHGNFLDKILNTDFSECDLLITHLWTKDMEYTLGNIDATEDGTITNAIKKITDHLKVSNGNTQLCVVSVPPVNTTASLSGVNVFTGKYPNGNSIGELDVLMHQMANKYKFIYIDWQELNLSFYYHDFTLPNNVHADNEQTYRIMGAYLAGRLSEQICF